MHESDYLWNEDETSQKYFMLANMQHAIMKGYILHLLSCRNVLQLTASHQHQHSYSRTRSRGRQPALMQGDEIILVSVTNCRDAAVECRAAVKCRAAVECVECSTVSACFELCCWQSICSSASWARSASDSRQRAPHLRPADHNISFSKLGECQKMIFFLLLKLQKWYPNENICTLMRLEI